MLISIAQGRIDTARHLISFHPQKNQSAFRAVDEQLRTMPNFAVSYKIIKFFRIKSIKSNYKTKYVDAVSFVVVRVQNKVGDLAEKVHPSAHKREFRSGRNRHS
jgi:hypothetical protein